MTENSTVGNEGAVGATGTPNQPVSPTPSQPIESDVTKLFSAFEGKMNEQFTAFTKNLGSEIQGLRKTQGEIDRSKNVFEEQLARFNQIKYQNNYTDEQALNAMRSQSAESEWRSGVEKKLDNLASMFTGAGTQVNSQQKATEVFAKLGIDPQDPRVAPHLAKQYENADAMELAAWRLKQELSNSPSPTSAQSASLQGGTSQQTDIGKLTEEYDRLSKNPTAKGNALRMAEIMEELNKI